MIPHSKAADIISAERMGAFCTVMTNLHEYSQHNPIPSKVEDFLNHENIQNFMQVAEHFSALNTQMPDPRNQNNIFGMFTRIFTKDLISEMMNDPFSRGELRQTMFRYFSKNLMMQIRRTVTLTVKNILVGSDAHIEFFFSNPKYRELLAEAERMIEDEILKQTTVENVNINTTNIENFTPCEESVKNTTKSTHSEDCETGVLKRINDAVDTNVGFENLNELQPTVEKREKNAKNTIVNEYLSSKDCVKSNNSNLDCEKTEHNVEKDDNKPSQDEFNASNVDLKKKFEKEQEEIKKFIAFNEIFDSFTNDFVETSEFSMQLIEDSEGYESIIAGVIKNLLNERYVQKRRMSPEQLRRLAILKIKNTIEVKRYRRKDDNDKKIKSKQRYADNEDKKNTIDKAFKVLKKMGMKISRRNVSLNYAKKVLRKNWTMIDEIKNEVSFNVLTKQNIKKLIIPDETKQEIANVVHADVIYDKILHGFVKSGEANDIESDSPT